MSFLKSLQQDMRMIQVYSFAVIIVVRHETVRCYQDMLHYGHVFGILPCTARRQLMSYGRPYSLPLAADQMPE